MSGELFQLSNTEEGTLVCCPDYFDITVANEFHGILCQLITDKPEKVIFDVDKLESIDTSILQTLCAFFQDASRQKINVGWKNMSEVLSRSAELLGLKAVLELEKA